MPIVKIYSNFILHQEQMQTFKNEIVALISELLVKPKNDVMLILSQNEMFIADSSDHAIFIEITCLSGLTLEKNEKICIGLRELFSKELDINWERVYLSFKEIKSDCGWRFKNNIPVCPALKNN